jgi:hypothetical protein
MAKNRFSHLRAGDLATFTAPDGTTVPAKVHDVTDGNTAGIVFTATRGRFVKGDPHLVTSNLRAQQQGHGLTSRTASETTLLVFSA